MSISKHTNNSLPVKVTALVCTYNYGQFLDRCLNSLLDQTYPKKDYEIVVVDDGSTDETSRVLKKYRRQIRVLRQSNQGLTAASNAGLRKARGEFLVRVDADDEMEPQGIKELAQALDENPAVSAVYCDRLEILEDTGVSRPTNLSRLNIFQIIAPGVMFRLQRVLDVGLYRHFYWEEHDLMARLLQTDTLLYLAKCLYRYHIHGNNMTSNDSARMNGWEALIEEWGIQELRRWGHDPELEQVFNAMEERNKATMVGSTTNSGEKGS